MRPEARPLVQAIEALADAMPSGEASVDAMPRLRLEVVRWLTGGTLDGMMHAIPDGMPNDMRRAAEGLAGLRRMGPEGWTIAYEALSAMAPVIRGGRLRLEASRQARKRRGSWYTPPVIVEAALDHGLDPLIDGIDDAGALARLRICDPAAGPGRFLLGAARRLAARLALLGAEQPRIAAVRCLWGADLDRAALTLARAALEDFAGAPVPQLAGQLITGDALTGPVAGDADAMPSDMSYDMASDAIDWRRCAPDGFDVVLGNPPYRAGRLARLDAERLRAVCPTAEYQLDPFALFLDRAARLARRRLALLVPTTWMSNHRGRRLREWLLGCHRLDALVEVPIEAFDAAVETAVAVFAIDAGPTAGPVPVYDLDRRRIATAHADGEAPAAPLPLTRSPRAAAILGASRQWKTTVGDVAEVTRGVNPYHHTTHSAEAIAARIHHADHAIADDWSPELRGRDLPEAYRLDWKGDHWIHYGPWLKEPRAPRFFRGPRLLVRKILGPTLCAVYIERDAYCDQSVYIARFAAGCAHPPFAVLACVNSRLIAELIRARHQTHRAHFPQLKVGELRGLPLPPVPPVDPRWAKLAADAEAMQRAPDPGLREAIEAAVEALYGLDGALAVDPPPR